MLKLVSSDFHAESMSVGQRTFTVKVGAFTTLFL